jgi:hypothetical protein
MADLTDLNLLEAAAGLRASDFSSGDLTRACLQRIDSLDGQLHAFLALTPDLAERQASAADERLARWRRDGGDPPPLLCGIPTAVKDVLCVKGVPTTAGSRILEGFRPPYTATSVERLIEAGIVVVGKTNTDEFALGLDAGTRRFIRWVSGRGCGSTDPAGSRHRYRRIDSSAIRLLRRHWAQDELWSRFTLRFDRLRLFIRYRRRPVTDCNRSDPRLSNDGRP